MPNSWIPLFPLHFLLPNSKLKAYWSPHLDIFFIDPRLSQQSSSTFPIFFHATCTSISNRHHWASAEPTHNQLKQPKHQQYQRHRVNQPPATLQSSSRTSASSPSFTITRASPTSPTKKKKKNRDNSHTLISLLSHLHIRTPILGLEPKINFGFPLLLGLRPKLLFPAVLYFFPEAHWTQKLDPNPVNSLIGMFQNSSIAFYATLDNASANPRLA